MNKYQEALNTISRFIEQWADCTEEIKVVQELVDKSKPRKVIFDEIDLAFRCPECGGTSIRTGCTDYYGIWLDIKFTHCSDCDQKLNWKIKENKNV